MNIAATATVEATPTLSPDRTVLPRVSVLSRLLRSHMTVSETLTLRVPKQVRKGDMPHPPSSQFQKSLRKIYTRGVQLCFYTLPSKATGFQIYAVRGDIYIRSRYKDPSRKAHPGLQESPFHRCCLSSPRDNREVRSVLTPEGRSHGLLGFKALRSSEVS